MKRFGLGLAYAVVFAAQAARSYVDPSYRFYVTGIMLLVSLLGFATMLVWRGRRLTRLDWLLPGILLLIGLVSYPATSRDFLRYLFDGEMIRLLHASPYVRLPYEFPVDQYSRMFDHIWWTGIPSPYGPLWQAVMVGINYVSGNHLIGGVIALKALNLLAVLAAARYLYLVTGRRWVPYVFMINPVVLLDTVATPHTDIVMAALILAAYHHARTPVRAGLLGAAGLIKLHGLMFLPFLARSRRELLALTAYAVGWLATLLLLLKPVTGFSWGAMLRAGQGGGVSGMQSLLMYRLFPQAAPHGIFLASYGLFLVLYGVIIICYARRRLSPLSAIALASLLVPICLTGVLLPWHFIIPFACLLACQKPAAYAAVAFFTLTVMRSAMVVPQLLETMALVATGGWLMRWIYRRISRPAPWMVQGAHFFDWL